MCIRDRPRTVIVWLPSVSAAGVNGEVQVAKLPLSTWHWIEVAPPVVVKATVGVLSPVGEATGVTATPGGIVSTTNAVEPLPTLPAASVARTVIVWLASESAAAGVNGDVQDAKAPASI